MKTVYLPLRVLLAITLAMPSASQRAEAIAVQKSAAFTCEALSARLASARFTAGQPDPVHAPITVLQQAGERVRPKEDSPAEQGIGRAEFLTRVAGAVVSAILWPFHLIAQTAPIVGDEGRRLFAENRAINQVMADPKRYGALWTAYEQPLQAAQDFQNVAGMVTDRDPQMVDAFVESREPVAELQVMASRDRTFGIGQRYDQNSLGIGVGRAGMDSLTNVLSFAQALPDKPFQSVQTADIPGKGLLPTVMNLLGGVRKYSDSVIEKFHTQLYAAALKIPLAYAQGEERHAQRVRLQHQRWFDLALLDLKIRKATLAIQIRRRILQWEAETNGRTTVDNDGHLRVDTDRMAAEDDQLIRLHQELEALAGERDRLRTTFVSKLAATDTERRQPFTPRLPAVTINRQTFIDLSLVHLTTPLEEREMPEATEVRDALEKARHAQGLEGPKPMTVQEATALSRDLFDPRFNAEFWNTFVPVANSAKNPVELEPALRSPVSVSVVRLIQASQESTPRAEELLPTAAEWDVIKFKRYILRKLISLAELNKKSVWSYGAHAMLGLGATFFGGLLDFSYQRPTDLTQTKALIEQLHTRLGRLDTDEKNLAREMGTQFENAQSRLQQALRQARVAQARLTTAAWYLTRNLSRNVRLGGAGYMQNMATFREAQAELEIHLMEAVQAQVDMEALKPAGRSQLRQLYRAKYLRTLNRLASLVIDKKIGMQRTDPPAVRAAA